MEVVNAYPHHRFKDWEIADYFYEGLTVRLKQLLESMCIRKFLSMSGEEVLGSLFVAW